MLPTRAAYKEIGGTILKSLTLGAAAFAFSFSVGICAGAANAGTAASARLYFGDGYFNRGIVFTDHSNNHAVKAGNHTATSSGATRPAGYIGASASRIRASDGAVRCSTSYRYNTSAASQVYVTGCNASYHSTYRSQGRSRTYRPAYGKYLLTYTLNSPNQPS